VSFLVTGIETGHSQMAEHRPDMPLGSVLIVEDEALVSMFLVDLVEDLGRTVIGPAANRETALKAAAADPPAIAIVDANLGYADDGIALAKELQDKHGTTIIFLSGHADLAADEAVLAVNPVAVLQKPCPPEELAAALRAAES
jgi:DNA-binding NarL/FixJ family response regulator